MDDPGDIGDTTEDAPRDPPSPTPEHHEHEIERLRAEVAALEAKVDKSGRRRRVGRRARNIAVGVLVVLTVIAFTASSIGVWASRNLLNNEVFFGFVATATTSVSTKCRLRRMRSR